MCGGGIRKEQMPHTTHTSSCEQQQTETSSEDHLQVDQVSSDSDHHHWYQDLVLWIPDQVHRVTREPVQC